MNTKNLQGQCQQCGGIFEFPAEAAGLMGECPHCGQQTECVLAAPPEEENPLRTKAIVFATLAAVILIGGLVGAQIALKRAKRLVGEKQGVAKPTASAPAKPVDPFAADSFRVSAVTLEKADGSSLVYARGSIINTTNRQRFGVKVELDLLDPNGAKVASTSDYQGVMEPNAEWKFRALAVDPKSVAAKVTSVKETK